VIVLAAEVGAVVPSTRGRRVRAGSTTAGKPPAEVVLPTIGYAVLVAEAAALTAWWATHEVRAADVVGHTIGWLGTVSMLLMHVYSIRKRVRALAHFGRLSSWLKLHIFLGLQGALLVCFHSAHLHTVGNISGATIACTLVVVASGIFGRYLYSQLPKALTGERLGAREIEAELAELAPVIAEGRAAHPALEAAVAAQAGAQPITGRMSFAALVREDARTRRSLRALERALDTEARTHGGPELERFASALRRRSALARRLGALTAAERVFRGWHLFHKPLTFVLFGVVVLHVVAHYIYTAGFGA
jgi:hypothetical protein